MIMLGAYIQQTKILPKENIIEGLKGFFGNKLQFMEDMLKEKKRDEWFQFIKILLDASISEGGIETDTIDEIFNKYKDGKI